jgi:hypothetical protein
MLGPPDERPSLRTLVATFDRELKSCLSGPASTTTKDELLGSWAELVTLLALGPEPELRACPVCKHTGMLAATRCGYCWTKLSPSFPGSELPQS